MYDIVRSKIVIDIEQTQKNKVVFFKFVTIDTGN